MKSTTIIFYGRDGSAAKALAVKIRSEGAHAQLRHAEAFTGEKEPCDRVVTLSCVSALEAARIAKVYGDTVVPLTTSASLPPPPPPGPPPNPLDGLAEDWKTQSGTDDLKKIAAAISGRSVDNRAQAVAVIEAALVARK